MILKITPKTLVNYYGWDISELQHSEFVAKKNNIIIIFTVEYKNGVYTNIKSVTDRYTDRCYTAYRYISKYISLTQNIGFELLKVNALWDYNNNCPALKTYKKDITPYYNRCIEKNISVCDFLTELMNNKAV